MRSAYARTFRERRPGESAGWISSGPGADFPCDDRLPLALSGLREDGADATSFTCDPPFTHFGPGFQSDSTRYGPTSDPLSTRFLFALDPLDLMLGLREAPGRGAFGPESPGLKAWEGANSGFMGECRDRRRAADFISAPRPPLSRLMNASPSDLVTVDMRGLKASLVACAVERRVSVSVVVRGAVVHELGLEPEGGVAPQSYPTGSAADAEAWIKLSIRMRRTEADRLDAGARAAKLSRGAYLAGLVDGVPVLLSRGGRPEYITALTASCAELSTLSRNVHQLTSLLRVGDVQQALAYRDLLDNLTGEVRTHLRVAAQVLAGLRAGRVSDGSKPRSHS